MTQTKTIPCLTCREDVCAPPEISRSPSRRSGDRGTHTATDLSVGAFDVTAFVALLRLVACRQAVGLGITSLTVNLDDDAAERLRRQTEQEGVTPGELARRLLTEATGQDPFASSMPAARSSSAGSG